MNKLNKFLTILLLAGIIHVFYTKTLIENEREKENKARNAAIFELSSQVEDLRYQLSYCKILYKGTK